MIVVIVDHRLGIFKVRAVFAAVAKSVHDGRAGLCGIARLRKNDTARRRRFDEPTKGGESRKGGSPAMYG